MKKMLNFEVRKSVTKSNVKWSSKEIFDKVANKKTSAGIYEVRRCL